MTKQGVSQASNRWLKVHGGGGIQQVWQQTPSLWLLAVSAHRKLVLVYSALTQEQEQGAEYPGGVGYPVLSSFRLASLHSTATPRVPLGSIERSTRRLGG